MADSAGKTPKWVADPYVYYGRCLVQVKFEVFGEEYRLVSV